MSRTLNELINAAVTGGEEEEAAAVTTVEVQQEDPVEHASGDYDIEKLAGALEYLGRRGMSNVLGLEKMAMAHCPGCGAKCKTCKGKACSCCKCGKTKKAGAASVPDSGTNDSQSHGEHVQSQVKHNAQSSPMKVPGYGLMPNNASSKPGGGAGACDTSGQGGGTHHAALASNSAAIGYDKKEKSKKVAPALAAVLTNKAYADGKLKENLSGAAGKGDKNIKTAGDLEAIKAELARRGEGSS